MYFSQDVDEFAVKDLSKPHHRIEIDFDARGENSWVSFSQYGELPEGEENSPKQVWKATSTI
jgi:hypothetical protein